MQATKSVFRLRSMTRKCLPRGYWVYGTFRRIIQLDRVFKFYRTGKHVKIVLDHISTVFQSGRSYGLLGVNGAGKSTTIRLIAGTELPNAGRVRRSVRVSWPLGLASGFRPPDDRSRERKIRGSRLCGEGDHPPAQLLQALAFDAAEDRSHHDLEAIACMRGHSSKGSPSGQRSISRRAMSAIISP